MPPLQDFCKILYGEGTDAETCYTYLFTLPDKHIEWFCLGGGAMPPLSDTQECYLGVGFQPVPLASGRGRSANICGIPGLWLDLDFASVPGAHRTTAPLPPDAAACQQLLAACPYEPTVVVHSGHGLQAYWLFHEPWLFAAPEDPPHAKALVQGWQAWCIAEGARRGWHVDRTHALTQVLRVPGSQNHKTRPARPVCLLLDDGPRYEPSDFEDYAAAHAPEPAALPSAPPLAVLPLSSRLATLLHQGDTEQTYPSRSEAVFAVVTALVEAGCEDAVIRGALMNPAWALSEMPMERGRRWCDAEIARARAKPSLRAVPSMNGRPPGDLAARDPLLMPWREELLTKKNGDPTTNVANIGLILANHPHWAGKFWWDDVRGQPMLEETLITDRHIVEIGQWLGVKEHMSISSLRPLEQCIVAQCEKQPRDVLQGWLNTLPPWDGTERLTYWLADCAGARRDAYGMAVAQILLVSMVARAMCPGCLYRYVVILEGQENTGKSSLVRALAGQEWYVELSGGLETKEAHMLLQGAWVAEMAELDSLTRTEETRLKAFITLTQDTWIPKYSNFKRSCPRRTIFVGTTNESSYLKGETGNTRFLPIDTQEIDIGAFLAMREQLFAEALQVYHAAPLTWWQFPAEVLDQSAKERESRRIMNVYEESLQEWLAPKEETSWQEIAESFLFLHGKNEWKDKSLQMQIGAALKLLGWTRRKKRNGFKTAWVWQRASVPTEAGNMEG